MTGGAAWAAFTMATGGVGFGLWITAWGLWPAKPRLAVLLAAALASPSAAGGRAEAAEDLPDGISGRRLATIALPAARRLHRAGLPRARVRADLKVTGRAPVTHVAVAVTAGIAGLLAPALLSAPLALVGAGVLPVWVWLLCGVVGFVLPDLDVRVTAARRRTELRRAIGAVLDLTAIALAGGAGVEQALHGAAAIGGGWAHERIRAALHGARITHTDPWTALGRLGADLGVEQLTELAATLALAGTEGARVRASLTAKAQALRVHQQTGDEAAAASATERMSLPVILLFAAYLVFIGYPALSRVLAL